jgi:hypothetical protein
MDSQLNEMRKGERTKNNPNRYNPRSNNKEGKIDISNQPTGEEKPAKDVPENSK